MANSTTNLDTISSSQASKEVTANALFDAMSAASVYGRRASTSAALTWGFYGGNVTKADGALVQIANGTVALTASATNYLVAAKATGAVSVSTTTTNWSDTANYWRLYSIITGGASVTSYTDSRQLAMFTGAPSFGALIYQGAWDASTNTPTLISSVGTKGYYFVVSVAGSTAIDGVDLWTVGDMVVFNGTTWQKVDASLSAQELGNLIAAATEKIAPDDADMVGLMDSASGNILAKLSWSSIKAAVKAYFDTLYSAIGHGHSGVYQPADADLDTWSSITPAANVGAFLASPTSANLAAAVAGETGTGALVFSANPVLTTPQVDRLGVGGGAVQNMLIRVPITATTTGSGTQMGINMQPTIGADCTTLFNGVYITPNVPDVAFTLPSLRAYASGGFIKGASATVTSYIGFYASDEVDATTNIGFQGLLSSGANKYNLYMTGTADNYLNGALTCTKAILSTSPTLGIGYSTGAGGTVTQTTSRTTGVTLNKTVGSITLVSAAGSPAWQSFTVTDSAVAATDTVKVIQKSGADKYMIHVTAAAAGSFEITFATTGGITVEQPVFSFAIFKGAIA